MTVKVESLYIPKKPVGEKVKVVSQETCDLNVDAVDLGEDDRYMLRALELAKKGIHTSRPNPAVGCVLVNKNQIVGEGWHRFAGEPHAEVNALKLAGSAARGSTMYVTLEPCCHQGRTPPCTQAIIKAGVSRVVIAIEDPNPLVNRAGISELQRAGIEVVCGVGRSKAKQINRGFLKRLTTGLPWITLKIATSLDGKTAMASGESQWITGEPARLDAHKLRAAASAVLTGVGTVLRDNPKMTARLEGVQSQPDRIILDSNLSTPADAKIFNGKGNVLILTTAMNGEHTADQSIPDYDRKITEVIECPLLEGRIDLHKVMQLLGKKQFNLILLEAGSRLSGSMLGAGLVDEIVLYMSPDMLGGDARDMFSLSGLDRLSDRIRFKYQDVIMLGRDLKITLTPILKNEK